MKPVVFLLLVLGILIPTGTFAIPLGQPVWEPGSSDILDVTFYRFEKPNAWWVNLGLPGDFFLPVQELSKIPEVYSLKGLEYGLGGSVWATEKLQAELSIPFESNDYTGVDGLDHSSVRPGDISVDASFLGLGKRRSAYRLAVNGWVSLPTGVSPFQTDKPILASGLGVVRAALGAWASERFGRFSFFQWINYEKSETIHFDRFEGKSLPGSVLYYPDQLYAGVRVEWLFYRRGPRQASLLAEARVRRWDEWVLDDFVWSPADRIFDSGLGLRVQVDRDMSVEGRWSYFPVEWSSAYARPDFGQTLTLLLCFHPFADERGR